MQKEPHDPRKAYALSIFDASMPNICAMFKQTLPDQPCMLCGAMSPDLWCVQCDAHLPYLAGPRCPICAQITPDGRTCGHCLNHPPAYARTIAAFCYEFPIDRLIQAMKYREQLALSKLFAKKLMLRIEQIPDCIIPMPLHPAKLKSRGFNQAHLIAAPIASALKIPQLACARLRDTPSQTGLAWKDRGENVRGAFGCDIDLTGKHVALIDDVMTSGASMNELAATVKKCGACEISAWVVARTQRDGA